MGHPSLPAVSQSCAKALKILQRNNPIKSQITIIDKRLLQSLGATTVEFIPDTTALLKFCYELVMCAVVLMYMYSAVANQTRP